MNNYYPCYEPLIAHLYGFMDMPEAFRPLLIPNLSPPVYYHEDTTVLHAGDTATMAYWPVKGYIRSFEIYQPEKRRVYYKQKTVDVSLPGKISLPAHSYMNQEPCSYSVQIARGSTVVSFSYDSFINMGKQIPEVFLLSTLILADAEKDWLKKMEMCKVKCLVGYIGFLDHFGHEVEDHLEVQHIASYIGATPEHLSTLRGM